MTSFYEILSNHAMQFVDDPRWAEQLEQNPSLFGRSKSQVLINAIPRFNRPPSFVKYLEFEEPSFDDYSMLVEETETHFEIETGKIEFELCSCGTFSKEDNEYRKLNFSYDSETGTVVIDDTVNSGEEIQIDFYTDGRFKYDLLLAQKRILGLCVAVDWYFKFADSYLTVANLITDKTFNLRSPSEHIRVNTERIRVLEGKLSAELMAFEQRYYEGLASGYNIMPNK